MKCLLCLILLMSTNFSFSQEYVEDFYHSSVKYNYPKYEDKDLIKLKTESYISDLKHRGYVIVKNEIKEYKIDIDISNKSSSGLVRFNVVYSFYDNFYTVDLWDPKYYLTKKKQWYHLHGIEGENNQMLDVIKKIIFKNYENEMNSNF